VSAQPEQEGLAPAAGGVEDDGVRELHPVIMWGKSSDFDEFDFRARPEAEEEVAPEVDDPKDSSAVNSALAEIYETLKTRDVDWSGTKETTASAEKASTPPSPSESGSQTSSESPAPKSGKSEPDVEK